MEKNYLISFSYRTLRPEGCDYFSCEKLVLKKGTWFYVPKTKKGKYYDFLFNWKKNSMALKAESLENCLEQFLKYLSYGHLPQKKELRTHSENFKNQLSQQRLVNPEEYKIIPFPQEILNFGNWPIKIISVEIFDKRPDLYRKPAEKENPSILDQSFPLFDHTKSQ